jgi:hypothetical protein
VNTTDQRPAHTDVKPTIVLVHGAYAQRADADIVEVEGSNVIMISQPQAVTEHFLKAARAIADSHR